ncbi:hypothetical protein MKK67_01175, partial [Methylobacterium sp. J-072]|uniref:hypothetical protein n=1 Tax=Methylobacterium sp. J-072 TaxID=2836651 RepID=UPI001FBB14DD
SRRCPHPELAEGSTTRRRSGTTSFDKLRMWVLLIWILLDAAAVHAVALAPFLAALGREGSAAEGH